MKPHQYQPRQARQAHQHRPQQGLSLIGVAIFMALLTLAAMGALYWVRFERNPITDIMHGTVQRPFGKQSKLTASAGTGVAGPAAAPAPVALSTEVRKCIINGKTVFSDTECPKTAAKLKLHDNTFAAPPKPVAPEQDASATLAEKATQRAIEQSTK